VQFPSASSSLVGSLQFLYISGFIPFTDGYKGRINSAISTKEIYVTSISGSVSKSKTNFQDIINSEIVVYSEDQTILQSSKITNVTQLHQWTCDLGKYDDGTVKFI
jgi:Fe-S-cluster formation regulator IscX/YfhJ